LFSSASKSRRKFIKYGLAGAVGFGVASAIEVPFIYNALATDDKVISQKNQQIQQLQSQIYQIPKLQAQVTAMQKIKTLSSDEASLLESCVETIIPTDDNGPGAKEAGVLYFIDKQLSGDYGNNSRWYMKGPFVSAGHTGPLTVDGITYPQGSESVPFGGPAYQYDMLMQEFWKTGLKNLQDYAVSSYGGKYETLSADKKVQVLFDLFNAKPENFQIKPLDFFNELIFLSWSGFLMDPVYGGNRGMVGWKLTGFVGANMGNGYGEGLNPQNLMVASTPTRLQPSSLGQYQKGLGLIGGGSQ
jgi:hypothetical protein